MSKQTANRRDFLKSAGLGAAAFTLGACNSRNSFSTNSDPKNKPNIILLAMMTLLLSLVLGILFAFGADYLDQSITTIKDLESTLKTSCLGAIPKIMSKDRPGVIADITGAIFKLDGDLADLNQSVLCGYLTMILIATFEQEITP